jgi:hypothetical protein
MKRAILIFGLILGVLLSINLVYMVYLCYNDPDFEPNMVLGYAVILVVLTTVFFGIKSYRDKYLNGIISLGHAFKTGALIAFVGATIYSTGVKKCRKGWCLCNRNSQTKARYPNL